MDEILFSLLQECVVRVAPTLDAERRIGTGCFVAPSTVLTCAHVVADSSPDGSWNKVSDRFAIQWRDKSYSGSILSLAKHDNDLALLKLDNALPSHPCAYLHESIRPGDMLYGFGYPVDWKGGDSSRYECEGLSTNPPSIKFTGGQVVPGLSGAPLLNERTGAVCGIIYGTRDRSSLLGGRAIPVSSIYSTFPDLRMQQEQYHHENSHWLRLLGTAEAYDRSVKLGNVVIPAGYKKLIEPLEAFFRDQTRGCADYSKNVFIMTRFQPGNKTLETIDKTIRSAVKTYGLVGHRADDGCYPTDRNLWDNVCTYMIGCKYGIAVLENILQNEFNPNVALEYGFMRALGKPVLLLKEKRMAPRADILGTLWEEFDMLEGIEMTIGDAINRWVHDFGI
jgi:hypothetical protein